MERTLSGAAQLDSAAPTGEDDPIPVASARREAPPSRKEALASSTLRVVLDVPTAAVEPLMGVLRTMLGQLDDSRGPITMVAQGKPPLPARARTKPLRQPQRQKSHPSRQRTVAEGGSSATSDGVSDEAATCKDAISTTTPLAGGSSYGDGVALTNGTGCAGTSPAAKPSSVVSRAVAASSSAAVAESSSAAVDASSSAAVADSSSVAVAESSSAAVAASSSAAVAASSSAAAPTGATSPTPTRKLAAPHAASASDVLSARSMATPASSFAHHEAALRRVPQHSGDMDKARLRDYRLQPPEKLIHGSPDIRRMLAEVKREQAFLLRRHDANHNGRIDAPELEAALRQQPGRGTTVRRRSSGCVERASSRRRGSRDSAISASVGGWRGLLVRMLRHTPFASRRRAARPHVKHRLQLATMMESQQQKVAHPCMVAPTSRWRRYWDVLSLLFTCVTVILLPLQFAFAEGVGLNLGALAIRSGLELFNPNELQMRAPDESPNELQMRAPDERPPPCD